MKKIAAIIALLLLAVPALAADNTVALYLLASNRELIDAPTPAPTPLTVTPQQDNAASILAATVRIKRTKGEGVADCGSGTIVESAGGKSLALACAHVFPAGESTDDITVETFEAVDGTARRTAVLPATLLHVDHEADLAIVAFDADCQPLRIAPRARVRTGDAITSAGCSNAADPTLLAGRIVSIDKWGPTKHLEATPLTAFGRSGGGLFNADNQLLGVLSTQAPSREGGLYVWLPEIYRVLDRWNLSRLYRPQPAAAGAASAQGGAAGSIHWTPWKEAQHSGEPTLVYVDGGPGCADCLRVERDVFTDRRVVAALAGRTLVRVAAADASKWGVRYVPWLLHVSPEWTIVGDQKCPTTPEGFLEVIK